jgi:uncharacterized protein YegJ (DUF2314 family)
MPGQQDLVPVFIPALGPLLIHAEDAKGTPLTEAEAITIRDRAAVVMMVRDDAIKMDQSRGYQDIDPENLWHDWQQLRDDLGRKPSLPRGPKVNAVRKGDIEFQQAAERARSSLPVFRLRMKSASKSSFSMVKTRVVDGGEAMMMWLNNVKEHGLDFHGTIFEIPSTWKNHKVGDVLTIAADTVLDWMIIDKEHLHGGFSIRVARQRKPENEREAFDAFIGVRTYEPLPV